MAPRGRDRDGSPHDAVVSNLMDIQARLRGDPASLVLPREGRREEPSRRTTVRSGDLSITIDDGDPDKRIETLRRRLEYLELEIDAYEQAAETPHGAPPDPPVLADVAELQHVVEERLTVDDDGAQVEETATE